MKVTKVTKVTYPEGKGQSEEGEASSQGRGGEQGQRNLAAGEGSEQGTL